MVKLDHKQAKTLRKFFGNILYYSLDHDIWELQTDAMKACGATVKQDYSEYESYRTGVLSDTHDKLDALWHDFFGSGGRKRPDDEAIHEIVVRARERLTFPDVEIERGDNDDTRPFEFHVCMPISYSEILGHEGGRELSTPDSIPDKASEWAEIVGPDGGREWIRVSDYLDLRFLEAKSEAYARYLSDETWNKERDWYRRTLADTMIGMLRRVDDDNGEFAACVMDWALKAFTMWHAEQYNYSRSKNAKAQYAGAELEHRLDILDNTVLELSLEISDVLRAGDVFPVFKPSGRVTVSWSLDRFMAAYSRGEFPFDMHGKDGGNRSMGGQSLEKNNPEAQRDSLGVHAYLVEPGIRACLETRIRACLETGSAGPRVWQRALAPIGDMILKSKEARE